MSLTEYEEKRKMYQNELEQYRNYKNTICIINPKLRYIQENEIEPASQHISSFTSQDEISILNISQKDQFELEQERQQQFLSEQIETVKRAQNYLNSKDTLKTKVVPKIEHNQHIFIDIKRQNQDISKNFEEQPYMTQQPVLVREQTHKPYVKQVQENIVQQKKISESIKQQPDNVQNTKIQHYQNILSSTQDFIQQNKVVSPDRQITLKQIELQGSLKKTISELTEMEKQNASHKETFYNTDAALMVERQSRILNNFAMSNLSEPGKLSLSRTEINNVLDQHDQPHLGDDQQQKSASIAIQSQAFKKSRKPQLQSQLFMARVSTFGESFGTLSQTSQDYLKWRRGGE
ncbi:hypothetical protein SS50377_23753 [Spironucleus salmonicida]|uniref:Uncharacterized protein n=1 Tax=Spironucleus salmonicida TaxID=348837 RepID=V6LP29_9EUKA|nr:hypothetical protein SS50377_23753 [Spironucleus salmonicida]|eukprot:EST46432.1 Hypothetical protein SS50377_13517 [Spironucleus salmonicida]